MLRITSAVLALALVAAGCGKSSGSGPGTKGGKPGPGGGGKTSGGPTIPVKPTDKPGDEPKEEEGWRPGEIPAAQKEAPYTSVFRVIKFGDSAAIENIRRIVVVLEGVTGTGASVNVKNELVPITTWAITGGGFDAALAKLKNDTHSYFKLKGTRVWDKRQVAPSGFRGEKHEYTMKVEQILWTKTELEYYNEMTNMEDRLNDVYLAILAEDPRTVRDILAEVQGRADDLGFGMHELEYDQNKRSFWRVTEAVDRIIALLDTIDKGAGDLEEAVARLKVYQEWNLFPPKPVTGDEDEKATQQAEEAKKAKMRVAIDALRQRLKDGALKLAAGDASGILNATSPTLTMQLANFAAEAGRARLAWELYLVVLGTEVERDWKRTTLSALKNAIERNAKFFDEFTDAELAPLAGRFRDLVIGFTKGDLMATRNATGILGLLKERKPGVAYAPGMDEVIAELKKK